jgi:hypothetical protein
MGAATCARRTTFSPWPYEALDKVRTLFTMPCVKASLPAQGPKSEEKK